MIESTHAVVTRVQKWHLLAVRQLPAKRWALVAGFIGLLLVASLARAQSCTPDAVTTPTPNGPQYNRFNGVTAFDANDVWAVGFTNGFNYQTLTEHWDGSSWTVIPSPNQGGFSTLVAAGGIATDDLWAVGSFRDTGFSPARTLTLHWDGVQWSVVPSPNLEGVDILFAVAAVASNDVWAVGEDSLPNPLLTHWDGLAWSLVAPPPNAGPQFAVAALAPDDVWSAGSGHSANNIDLFNHWDGTSWTTIPNPPLTPGWATIRALSALAPNDVWAAGSVFVEFCDDTCFDDEQVTVLHWDGQTWSVVRPPNTIGWSRLTGIAAESTASVWAVGLQSSRTLASHWDGTQWSNAPNIQIGAGTLFDGVTVVGANAWAVGYFALPGKDQTFAVRLTCNQLQASP